MGRGQDSRDPDKVLTQIKVLGWGLKGLSRVLSRGRVSAKAPAKEQAMGLTRMGSRGLTRDLTARGRTKSRIAGQTLDQLAGQALVQDMV